MAELVSQQLSKSRTGCLSNGGSTSRLLHWHTKSLNPANRHIFRWECRFSRDSNILLTYQIRPDFVNLKYTILLSWGSIAQIWCFAQIYINSFVTTCMIDSLRKYLQFFCSSQKLWMKICRFIVENHFWIIIALHVYYLFIYLLLNLYTAHTC